MESQGISFDAITALKLLTHDDSVPYFDYVQRIKDSGNQAAIAVKLADLRHNSDISRLNTDRRRVGDVFIEGIDEKTAKRLEKYKTAIDILECYDLSQKIYIDKEVATGLMAYVLRIGETSLCASKNNSLMMPRPFAAPIQTDDLINKKTFSTYRNPEYENITIVPGLKLEYAVCIGDNPNPVAKMERKYGKEMFSSFCHYCIFDESNAFPRIYIDNQAPSDPDFLERLPINDVSVCIYPDESFVYDSCSLVEERYVVSIAKQHLQWLPHIFHFFILRGLA